MRRLVAALACRAGGSRLYGKPLQNLAPGVTILDQIVDSMRRIPQIDDVVLGISEGIENLAFVDFAIRRKIPYIFGDQIDVLSRLISCGRIARATDIFRVTTESPFVYHEGIASAWTAHCEGPNDATFFEALPDGAHFEIIRLEALEISHAEGSAYHRSEGCTRFIRQNLERFRVKGFLPPPECRRSELRLTVDYPEDLALCRRVYEHFKEKAPLLAVRDIVAFLDANPGIKSLTEPYGKPFYLWPEYAQRAGFPAL